MNYSNFIKENPVESVFLCSLIKAGFIFLGKSKINKNAQEKFMLLQS